MKKRILKMSELLMLRNSKTSTLEVKNAMRTLFPLGDFRQEEVSNLMKELSVEENWNKEMVNDTYFNYSLKETADTLVIHKNVMDIKKIRIDEIYNTIAELIQDDLNIKDEFDINSHLKNDLDFNKRDRNYLLEQLNCNYDVEIESIDDICYIHELVGMIYDKIYDTGNEQKNAIFDCMWVFVYNIDDSNSITLNTDLADTLDKESVKRMLTSIIVGHNIEFNGELNYYNSTTFGDLVDAL